MTLEKIEKVLLVTFFCLIPFDYMLFGCLLKNIPIIGFWNDLLLIFLIIVLSGKIYQTKKLDLNMVEYSFIFISILLLISIVVTGHFISNLYMLRIYIVPMAYYFVMRRIHCSEKLLSIIVTLIVILATAISIYGIFQAFILGDTFLEAINYRVGGLTDAFYLHLSDIQRVTATFVAPNTCSMYLIFTLIISLFLNQFVIINKFFLRICQSIILIAIITTFSRTGWIALAICIIVYLIRYYRFKEENLLTFFKTNYKKIIFYIVIFSIALLLIDICLLDGIISQNILTLCINTLTFNDTSLNAHIYSIINSLNESFSHLFGFGLYGVGPKATVVSNPAYVKLPESSLFVMILSVGFIIGIFWIISYMMFLLDAKRLRKEMRFTIEYLILALFIFYLSLPMIQEIDVMSFLFGFIGLISSRTFIKDVTNVSIYSKHDISSAYSTLIYLKQMLKQENFDVSIWSWTEKENKQLLKKADSEGKSFLFYWYSYIPKIRFLIAIFHSYCITYINNSVVLINDIDFFPAYYFYKKLFKSTKVIHFCTEIYGEDIQTKKFNLDFYEKHADYPDMIIECLQERAKYRQKEYSINKEIYVINNTLPLKNYKLSKNVTFNDYFSDFNSKGNPIVIYAGAAYLNRDLDKFIQGLQMAKSQVCFVAFCYGSKEDLYRLQDYCKEHLKKPYYIHSAISRTELVSVMENADIGIVYYDPNKSINYRFASPTKFFEYMSNGLNILCSNNEGINHIIQENHIGACIMENTVQGIADAYDYMIKCGLKNKEEIKNLFKEKYCYEIDSFNTIQAIKKLLKGASQ